MTLFEKISNNIASGIAKKLEMDKDKQAVIAYGAYALLDILTTIGMVMIFGALLGVFFEALVVLFSSALLRKTSGGAHATTTARCVFIGTLTSVGFALIINSLSFYLNIPIIILYLIFTFLISYFIIRKLAPKDSPNKRIVKEAKIKELKAKSIRTLYIYTAICLVMLIIAFYKRTTVFLPYISLICTGHLWQSFTLTSLGYKFSYILETPFRYIKLTGGENK